MPWTCRIVLSHAEKEEPGDMWPVWNTRDNRTDWLVILPNGGLHNIHGRSSDGTPWDVTGEAPNFTVSPSINRNEIINRDTSEVWKKGWHGWLENGVLSDDCEGRTYE